MDVFYTSSDHSSWAGLSYLFCSLPVISVISEHRPKSCEILAKEIGLFADEIEIYGKSKAKVRFVQAGKVKRIKQMENTSWLLGKSYFLNLLLRIHVCKTLHPIYIATPSNPSSSPTWTLFCPFHLVLLHLMWDKFLFSVQTKRAPFTECKCNEFLIQGLAFCFFILCFDHPGSASLNFSFLLFMIKITARIVKNILSWIVLLGSLEITLKNEQILVWDETFQLVTSIFMILHYKTHFSSCISELMLSCLHLCHSFYKRQMHSFEKEHWLYFASLKKKIH